MSDEEDLMDRNAMHNMARTSYQQQSPDNESLLRDLTDVQPEIDETELLLQGMRYDSEGKQIRVCEPLCNKEGAIAMCRLMTSMVGKIMLMSNLEEDQIRVMTQELGNDIIEDLTFNRKRYGISQIKAISAIDQIIVSKAFECGMSALENGTRQMLKKSIIETNISTHGTQPKVGKGGIGGFMKGLRG